MVRVSWHDTTAYCKWLSEVTGKIITLPTEAQWEKAARVDKDKREYPWGDQWQAGCCNSKDLGVETTTPVGIFPEGASPYGCLDLVGNVCKWCNDWYAEQEYVRSAGSVVQNPVGPKKGDYRILRGGSFYQDASRVRCAYRDDGFRVARSIPSAAP